MMGKMDLENEKTLLEEEVVNYLCFGEYCPEIQQKINRIAEIKALLIQLEEQNNE